MQKAEQTGDQMDVQVVNDLNQFLDRLDKRTHDLTLARQITIQQGSANSLNSKYESSLSEKRFKHQSTPPFLCGKIKWQLP